MTTSCSVIPALVPFGCLCPQGRGRNPETEPSPRLFGPPPKSSFLRRQESRYRETAPSPQLFGTPPKPSFPRLCPLGACALRVEAGIERSRNRGLSPVVGNTPKPSFLRRQESRGPKTVACPPLFREYYCLCWCTVFCMVDPLQYILVVLSAAPLTAVRGRLFRNFSTIVCIYARSIFSRGNRNDYRYS